jgi:hypothetical protein
MTKLAIRNDALVAIMLETPEYKELVLKAEAIQAKALSTKYEVKSLGATLTLKEIAQVYAGLRGLATSYFGEYDSYKSIKEANPTLDHKSVMAILQGQEGYKEADKLRLESFAYKVSQECLAIIQKTGYKADTEGIQGLIQHA